MLLVIFLLFSITFSECALSSLSRTNYPSTGSFSVTLLGSISSCVSVSGRTDGTAAESALWISTSSIICKTAAGSSKISIKMVSTGSQTLSTAQDLHTFDVIQLSSTIRANLWPTASSSITLVGSSFSGKQQPPSTLSASIGKTAFSSRGLWLSSTTIKGKSPPIPRSLSISLAISAAKSFISTLTNAFTSDGPVVSSASMVNGAATGSTSITLVGKGLSQIFSSVAARLGSSRPSASWWVSETAASLKRSLGFAGSTLGLVATTWKSSVNTLTAILTVDTPAISAQFRSNAATTGSTSITLLGNNQYQFETVSSRLLASSSPATTWISTSAIVPKGISIIDFKRGSASMLAVTVWANKPGTVSSYLSFGSLLPSNAVFTNAAATGSTSLTLLATVALFVSGQSKLGFTPASNSKWTSSSSIAVKSPSTTASTTRRLQFCSTIWQNSRGSITNVVSADIPTVIGSFSRSNGPPTGGTSVTLQGSGYGINTATTSSKLSGTSSAATVWVSTSSVSIRIPFVAGGSRPFATTSGPNNALFSLPSTMTAAFTTNPPLISSLASVNVAPTASTSMTISGSNLASSGIAITVKSSLGASQLSSTKWVADSAVMSKCISVADRKRTSVGVMVTLSMIVGSSTNAVSYNTHLLTNLVRTNVPNTGASIVTLAGSAFGQVSAETANIRFRSSNSDFAIWSSDSTVKGKVSSGGHREASMYIAATIYQTRTTGTLSKMTSFDAPSLSSGIASNIPTTGAFSVTITGLILASPIPITLSARIGYSSIETSVWLSVTSFASKTPRETTRLSSRSQSIISTIGSSSLVGTVTRFISYTQPLVSSQIRSNSPRTGAVSMTLTAAVFGDRSPSIRAFKTTSESTWWIAESSVRAKLSSSLLGASKSCLMMISAAFSPASLTSSWTHDSTPAIFSEIPSNSPTTGSTSVTLYGKDMGIGIGSNVARFGLSSSVSTMWSSDSSLNSKLPRGVGLFLSTTISLASYFGTISRATSFNGILLINQLSPTNSVITGSLSVTIFSGGLNPGNDLSASARLGGASSPMSVRWVSETAVLAKPVQRGSGRLLTAAVCTVFSSTNRGTHSQITSIDTPIVSSVLVFNSPTTGSNSITLMTQQAGGIMTPGNSRIGFTAAHQTSSWISDSAMSVKIAQKTANTPNIRSVVVSMYSYLRGSITRAVSYSSAFVSATIATNIPSTASTIVTLTGFSVATSSDTINARIGYTSPCSAWWQSASAMYIKTASSTLTSTSRSSAGLTVWRSVSTLTSALSYNWATISSSTPTNLAPTSSQSVTITGSSSLPIFASISLSLGSTSSETSFWMSATSIRSKTPRAALPNRAAVASNKPNNAVTLSSAVTYAVGAVIASISSYSNVPATGSLSLTLQGLYLPQKFSEAVPIGFTASLATSWISTTTLASRTPTGTGTTRSISVTLWKSSKSTMTNAVTFPAISVTSSVASNTPGTGATSVTLYNMYNCDPFTPKSAVGMSSSEVSNWISQTSVLARSSRGIGTAKPLKLTVFRSKVTLTNAQSHDPAITSIVRVNAPTTGATYVSIFGAGLVVSATSGLRTGYTAYESVQWKSSSMLLCKTPSAVHFSVNLRTTAIGVVLSLTNAFSSDSFAPLITSNPFNMPATGSTLVTMTGWNLPLTFSLSQKFAIGLTASQYTAWGSSSSIRQKVSSGIGFRNGIMVSVAPPLGWRKTVSNTLSYDSPNLSSFIRVNLPTSSAISITVAGCTTNNNNGMTFISRIGRSACESSTWVSSSSTRCKTTKIQASGFLATATTFGSSTPLTSTKSVGSSAIAISYDVSRTTLINPSNAPLTGGISITIAGNDMGEAASTIKVRLHLASEAATWNSDTSAFAKSPSRISRLTLSTMVFTITKGLMSTLTNSFTANGASAITNLAQNGNTQATGSGSITLVGSTWFSSPAARFGSTSTENANWRSTTSVQCRAARGSSINCNAIATVVMILSSCSRAGTYDAPSMSTALSSNFPATAATSVTIAGSGYGGGLDLSLRSGITATSSEAANWISDSTVICKSPSGWSGIKNIRSTSWRNIGTTSNIITYAPTQTWLSSTMRGNVPETGSVSITMSGLGFTGVFGSPIIVGGQTCAEAALWVSGTSIRAKPGTGLLSWSNSISSTVRRTISSMTKELTYAGISNFKSISNPNVPGTGATSVTMQGARGLARLTLQQRIGGSASENSIWVSQTTMKSKSTPGVTLRRSVAGTTPAFSGTLTNAVSFDPATSISLGSILNRNIPSTGAVISTLTGLSLGFNPPFSAGARIGLGTSVELSLWLSSSSIKVKIPAGGASPEGSPIIASLANLKSTVTRTYSTDLNIMPNTCLPNNHPNTGSRSITFTSAGLGTSNTSPKSHIGATNTESAAWKSDSSLIIKGVAALGRSLQLSITSARKISTATNAITYPVTLLPLSSILRANSPTTGAISITIGGEFTQGRTITFRTGKTTFESSVWISSSSMATKYARSISSQITIIGTNALGVGCMSMSLSFDLPNLATAISGSNYSPTGGISIAIGSTGGLGSFNASPASRIGVTAVEANKWLSDSSMWAKISAGYGGSLSLSVTVAKSRNNNNGIASTISRDASSIKTIIGNSNIPTTGAMSVTLSGLNFGMTGDWTAAVRLQLSSSLSATWKSITSVSSKLVPGGSFPYSTSLGLTLTIAKTAPAPLAIITQTHSYHTYIVSNYLPSNAPPTGARSVSIMGVNLVSSDGSVKGRIGVLSMEVGKWASDTSMYGKIAASSGLGLNLVVSLSRSSRTFSSAMTYDGSVPLVPASTPVLNPAGGQFSSLVSITISTATSGASIRYTTDGSTATSQGLLYSGPVVLSSAGQFVVRAIAVLSGMANSAEAVGAYIVTTQILDAPTILPTTTLITSGRVVVSISTAVTGAVLQYMINGTQNTNGFIPYTQPISISGDGTYVVSAIAVKAGASQSTMATRTYTITSTAAAVCGDGIWASSEGCDDGNTISGDGCSSNCTVEARYSCTGSPSVCSCIQSYYGAGCGTFCSRDTTCNSRGNCTTVGACQCDLNYFGSRCDVFQLPQETAAAAISPGTGGSFSAPSSGVSISIPGGAVSSTVTLSAQVYAPSVAKGALTSSSNVAAIATASNITEFLPTGQQFAVPVAISISFSQSVCPGGANCFIHTLDETKGVWVQLSCTLNLQQTACTTQVSHFSKYGVFQVTMATSAASASPGSTTAAAVINTGSTASGLSTGGIVGLTIGLVAFAGLMLGCVAFLATSSRKMAITRKTANTNVTLLGQGNGDHRDSNHGSPSTNYMADTVYVQQPNVEYEISEHPLHAINPDIPLSPQLLPPTRSAARLDRY